MADKEPALVVDQQEGICLYWHSQRGAWRSVSRSVDTSDPDLLHRIGKAGDTVAYTYDCGRPDGHGGYHAGNDTHYNAETIGLHVIPDVDSEPFTLPLTWERVQRILAAFLPIYARAVLVVEPRPLEEQYDTLRKVSESLTAALVGADTEEAVSLALEAALDRIPGWRRFYTNDLSHRTIDTAVRPIDTRSRTWHTGLERWL